MIKKRFFLALLFTSFPLLSATIGIDGKNHECTKRNQELYVCVVGSNSIAVKKNGYSFIAVSAPNNNELKLHKISKIIDGPRIVFEESGFTKTSSFDFSVTGSYEKPNAAITVLENFKNDQDPIARDFYKRAKTIKDEEDKLKVSNITIKIGKSGKSMSCQRGENSSSAQNINAQCAYFSCVGNGPEEKILAYLPNPMESFRPAEVLTMKNGQAELVQSNFTVSTDNNIPIMNVPAEDTQWPSASPIDDDLFVPSKYDQSKSSFNELVHSDPEVDPFAELCKGQVKSLIDERNKISKEMKAALIDADIVEYLKLNDGNINSYYIDRKKAQALGCLYNNKILDAAVLNHLDYLKSISAATGTAPKYLSLDEVQDLFKKARNMKDIPFGYKYDGCYARAHLMARRFEAEGIPTQKVWIKGNLFVPGTDIEWNYHVAPIVDVKEANGEIKKYVIDPSLNQKAVPIDEWVASMGSNLKGPVMKTTYPFPANSANFQRTTVAISSSDPFAPIDIRALDEKTKIEQATMVLANFAEALKESEQELKQ